VKAAVLEGPDELTLGEVPAPRLEPGDLLIRVKASTICGTDIRIFRGRKTLGVRYPSILGHEFSGEIVEAGGHPGLAPGQRVGVCPTIPCGHCEPCRHGRENLCPNADNMGYQIDGAFAEYVRVPRRAVEIGCVHRLPDELDHAQAALVEPLACVLNGQNIVRVGTGDSVVILGAGPIGLLHVKLARLKGAARVIVSEPNGARRDAAGAAGADATVDPIAEDLHERVRAETNGLGASVVICAIGIPALVQQAIGLAALRGRVSLFAGFSKGDSAALDVNAIHYNELTVTGAFGLSRVDYADALSMAASGRIELASLITHRFGLADAGAAFALAERGEAVKVAFLVE
jgi:L-iditol 2-dehydrogenase